MVVIVIEVEVLVDHGAIDERRGSELPCAEPQPPARFAMAGLITNQENSDHRA
jgi:hypothetical protein